MEFVFTKKYMDSSAASKEGSIMIIHDLSIFGGKIESALGSSSQINPGKTTKWNIDCLNLYSIPVGNSRKGGGYNEVVCLEYMQLQAGERAAGHNNEKRD